MVKWTREKIIREILRRESAGQPLDVGCRDPVKCSLYQAAGRVFGSWRNAVIAAGISPQRAQARDSCPPSRVLTRIKALARRKRPITPRELRRRYQSLVTAAQRCFGSWPKAVIAAGIDPAKFGQNRLWTNERIMEAILKRALHGQPLNSHAVTPKSLVEAGAKVFGSWNSAVDAAGVCLKPDQRRRPAFAAVVPDQQGQTI